MKSCIFRRFCKEQNSLRIVYLVYVVSSRTQVLITLGATFSKEVWLRVMKLDYKEGEMAACSAGFCAACCHCRRGYTG